MDKRIWILLLFLALFLIGLRMVMNYKRSEQESRILYATFPFLSSVGDRFLDSTNLQNVSDYYLLENLSIGLLRDDPADENEYEPALAQSWKEIDSKTWVFYLRPDLKWSNGSPITASELTNGFLRFRGIESRHLRLLPHLESVRFDEASRALFFHFDRPVYDEILHELSLADAVLLHPENIKGNWSITSGPYSLEKWDQTNERIHLRGNPYCPLFKDGSPRNVILYTGHSVEEITKLFLEIPDDLFPINPWQLHPVYQSLLSHAPSKLIGIPNYISYFCFTGNDVLFNNEEARVEFEAFVHEALSQVLPTYYDQMIPPGFAGHLDSNWVTMMASSRDFKLLKTKTIWLNLPKPYQYFPEFEKALVDHAKAFGIDLRIAYQLFPTEKPDHDYFAEVRFFKGNQRDALGTWNFLFSKTGALARFKDKMAPDLERISMIQEEAERILALKAFHESVLRHAYAIPFRVDPTTMLISERVDLSRWNRFDMRDRYYDVRWR